MIKNVRSQNSPIKCVNMIDGFVMDQSDIQKRSIAIQRMKIMCGYAHNEDITA